MSKYVELTEMVYIDLVAFNGCPKKVIRSKFQIAKSEVSLEKATVAYPPRIIVGLQAILLKVIPIKYTQV